MENKNKKIRLLIIEPFLTVGGEEKIVLNLLKHLDTQEFAAEILCCSGGPLLPEVEKLGFPLHFVRIKSKWDWSAYTEIRQVITKGSFDVVHGHSSFAGLFARCANLLAGKLPIVWTEHLLPHQHHQLTMASPFWGRLYTIPFYLLELVTDKMIYVSATMMKERMAYKLFDLNKMIVIPNGISIDFPDYVHYRNTFRKNLGVKDNLQVIGIITVLKKQKGVDIFLHSLKVLRDKTDNFLGVVIGKGPDEIEIKKLCRDLGLEKQVVFTGEETDVRRALAGMDIAVLPSRFEGMSVTLLEYMAAGLPIVASDIDNNVEVLGEDSCGLIFPSEDYGTLADKLQYLLNSPEKRQGLGKNAKKRYEDCYSAVIMTEKYQQLYRSLVSGCNNNA